MKTAPVTQTLDLLALRIRVAELLDWTETRWDQKFLDKWWHGHPIGLPPENKGEEIDAGNMRILPDWPADLNAAIQLCDVLKEKGWIWDASAWQDDRVYFAFVHKGSMGVHSAIAPTLSEAICRAFVAVMEQTLEEKEA